jgi:hypothetical protein
VDNASTARYRTLICQSTRNKTTLGAVRVQGPPCAQCCCYHRLLDLRHALRVARITHGIHDPVRPLREVVVVVVEDAGELALIHLTVEAGLDTRLTGGDANLTSSSKDHSTSSSAARFTQHHREVLKRGDEVVGESGRGNADAGLAVGVLESHVILPEDLVVVDERNGLRCGKEETPEVVEHLLGLARIAEADVVNLTPESSVVVSDATVKRLLHAVDVTVEIIEAAVEFSAVALLGSDQSLHEEEGKASGGDDESDCDGE